MKYFILFFLIILSFPYSLHSQNLYFPPLSGNNWATTSPESLGWCVDKLDTLLNFLDEKNTKSFIVLKDGKIVIEHYFDSFTKDSIWYWASAGKTLTAFLTGIAQEEGYLSVLDSTSKFLGSGWTSLIPEKEKLITIRHQLTMSSGLNDLVADNHCTLPSCLIYKADAGTRWAYHNAPYTLLEQVIQIATGQNYNIYFNAKIKSRIGMNGIWLHNDYDNVYYSNTRSMARYGILIQNKGVWNSDTLLHDTDYFNAMVNTSQNLNLSYGYLWWLNGKYSFMLPQLQIVFPGYLMPDAPPDMISALGKNGQILNVVPSLGIVVVRMGEIPDDDSDITPMLSNDIWQKLNSVICNQTSVEETNIVTTEFKLEQNYPNPFNPGTIIKYSISGMQFVSLKVYDILGNEIATLVNKELPSGNYQADFNTQQTAHNKQLPSGIYFYRLQSDSYSKTKKMILLR